MKISNVGVTSTPPSSQQQAGAVAAGAGQPNTAAGTATAASAYTPSAQLLKMMDLVRQQPGVRADQVQAATQRLQQGFYHTSAAADQTAAAMLATVN